MSSSAPLAWAAAPAAAAYPTWDAWRTRFEWPAPPERIYEEYYAGDAGGFAEGSVRCDPGAIDRSPFLLVRDDLATLAEVATTWAVPVLIVLFALVRRCSPTAAPRAAWALTLLAVIRPLSADYRGEDVCSGSLPLFTADWFEAVLAGWELGELWLLGAALLVLLASGAERRTFTPVRSLRGLR
ncbi:hypothetical protein WBK31_16265 [Nonomuraea sp. N2-4H]|uniref:hypothetical protein n=1 Tax=Nonomuraea sp. N2-4H TaxID=3128898 RepID=UPI00324C3D94